MSHLDKFHYVVTGPESAPKIVFLHGVMGFAANWRRIAKAFEDRFQVLVFDQRGHGRSFHAPEGGYQLSNYAADLKSILDELGWQKISLVGHSMGGRVALEFVAQCPQRVTRLVVEDIGPIMQASGSSLLLRLLDSIPVPFSSKREAKVWFDTRFMELFQNERQKQGLAAYLYANLVENEKKEAVWRFSDDGVRESVAAGRDGDQWDVVRNLVMPTLFIRGEFSRDFPREIFQQVLQESSLAEGVEIQGAGHWVHSDQPEIFIRVLTQFFAGKQQPLISA
jgi:pimeloyl-ACP methyl ester carboxylesterase